jgi:hypothetical protein
MPVAKTPFPVDYLKERITYDPESGRLYWSGSLLNKAYLVGLEAGTLRPNGHRQVSVGGTLILSHRVAWALHSGEWPTDTLDHINGDRADNRIINLRQASMLDQVRNRAQQRKSRNPYLGVRWRADFRKWAVEIGMSNRTLYIGSFACLEDAIAARHEAEKQYGFHPNHGRPLSET